MEPLNIVEQVRSCLIQSTVPLVSYAFALELPKETLTCCITPQRPTALMLHTNLFLFKKR